jgi:hypothetical protein
MEEFILEAAAGAAALLLEALVLRLIRRIFEPTTGAPGNQSSGIRWLDYWMCRLGWSLAA